MARLKSSQGQNANDVYFAQLADYSRQLDHYIPSFTYTEESKNPNQIRGQQWDDIMFETSIDVYDEDLELFKSTTATPADLQEHLAYMISDARRKTEVSLRNLTADERKLIEQAKDKEVDQWISNSVFKIVRRTGVPITRIMAMRWILTWKKHLRARRPKPDLWQKASPTQTS